jgi:hypothetical protein
MFVLVCMGEEVLMMTFLEELRLASLSSLLFSPSWVLLRVEWVEWERTGGRGDCNCDGVEKWKRTPGEWLLVSALSSSESEKCSSIRILGVRNSYSSIVLSVSYFAS